MMQDKEFENYEKAGYLLDGKYKYISPIQDGSFGKVTLAFDTVARREVAMKAMYKLVPETRRMANHEIQILTKLGNANDNICQLLDHFETSEYVVLVLEYCSSGDLYDLIHSGLNISALDLWHMAKELSHGIKYANSLGIYHRDIKPENVLFNGYGRVKLCDWGLSTTNRYSSQFNVGTEKYLAPECKKPEGYKTDNTEDSVYDCLYSDYWSLGITLLTAVFGTAPFKSVDNKNLNSDSNYKYFVNMGKSDVLYDIYPTMNENCFSIFTNLLKIAGQDDKENNKRKIESRDLDSFLQDLENNWKFGLTIDEEYDIETLGDGDEYNAIDSGKNSDLFDMDHDDLGFEDSLTDPTTYDEDEEAEEYEEELKNYVGVTIPKKEHAVFKKPNSMPSLIASTGKSWCDFDDDVDDDEEKDRASEGLGILIEDLTIDSANKRATNGGNKNMGVEIHEREINNWHTTYRV